MPPKIKNKICCDELKHEIGELPRLVNLKRKKLKPEDSSTILYCPVLSNCHYKCQLKTIFIFGNW